MMEPAQILRSLITEEMVFAVLEKLNAEPVLSADGTIMCKTVCHCGSSHKLYVYHNEDSDNWLCRCYTECDSIGDIIQLIRKVKGITLNEAEIFVQNQFNLDIDLTESISPTALKEWRQKAARRKQEILERNLAALPIRLPEMHDKYYEDLPSLPILLWEEEGIKREVSRQYGIKFDPIRNSILIPYYDDQKRMIGIRQRFLQYQDVAALGKYIPWKKYTFPLGQYLYGFYEAKQSIKESNMVFVFEGEKSVLKARSNGINNAVAMCGSAISWVQLNLLKTISQNVKIYLLPDKDWKEESLTDLKFFKARNFEKTIQHRFLEHYDIYVKYSYPPITEWEKGDSPIDKGVDNWTQFLLINGIC